MSEKKEAGYVYILTNPSFREDWVKIGMSSRPVDVRSKELDNTAVPLPFEIYATMRTIKYKEAEKLVHRYIERFTNLRIRDNREFFNVKPEDALSIFYDVALLLDDAEIKEVHKMEMLHGQEEEDPKETKTGKVARKDGVPKIWMIPYNKKFFNLKACYDKVGIVYWTQRNNVIKGDIGYVYGSMPEGAVRFRFEVLEAELPYSKDMDSEVEFYSNPADFEPAKEHNRFMKLRITGETTNKSLALVNLMDHGLKKAPQGALNLSYEGYKDLLAYIQENF